MAAVARANADGTIQHGIASEHHPMVAIIFCVEYYFKIHNSVSSQFSFSFFLIFSFLLAFCDISQLFIFHRFIPSVHLVRAFANTQIYFNLTNCMNIHSLLFFVVVGVGIVVRTTELWMKHTRITRTLAVFGCTLWQHVEHISHAMAIIWWHIK